MITLTGNTSISTLKKQIQTPQDGVDNVEQISIQPAFQDLLNNIYCTIDKLPYLKPSLSMYSIDGATIVVKPFAGLWASKFAATSEYTVLSTTTDTSVTSAKLSPSGSFAADTIYYLYAYLNGTSTDFVIRTDAPDTTKTYAVVGGVTRLNERYIGSFIVIAGPTVVAFSKNDQEYNFVRRFGIGVYSDIVDTDVPVNLLPPTTSTCKLVATLTNTNVATNGSLELKPKGSTFNTFVNVAKNIPGVTGATSITMPAIGTPKNTFQAKFSGGVAAGECTAYMYWTGYTE